MLEELEIPESTDCGKEEFKIGLEHYRGQGGPIDYTQAMLWFEMAAKEGLAAAQFHLGSMYYHGKGTSINQDEAFYLFKEAAEQDLAVAQIYLGKMHYYGKGKPVDYEKALYRRKKVSEGRSSEAVKKTRQMRDSFY